MKSQINILNNIVLTIVSTMLTISITIAQESGLGQVKPVIKTEEINWTESPEISKESNDELLLASTKEYIPNNKVGLSKSYGYSGGEEKDKSKENKLGLVKSAVKPLKIATEGVDDHAFFIDWNHNDNGYTFLALRNGYDNNWKIGRNYSDDAYLEFLYQDAVGTEYWNGGGETVVYFTHSGNVVADGSYYGHGSMTVKSSSNSNSPYLKLIAHGDGNNYGDPFVSWELDGAGGSSGGGGWSMGIDNDNDNRFKLVDRRDFNMGSGNANVKFVVEPSGDVGIGINDPTSKLHVKGAIRATENSIFEKNVTVKNDLTVDGSQISLYQDQNNSNAHAKLKLRTNGANSGDPFVSFEIGNSGNHSEWSMGIDNSDDNFKLIKDYDFDGSVATDVHMVVKPTGQVGIGINPGHKLHVGGTFRANGNAQIGGTLTVTNAITAQNGLIVNHEDMTVDNTGSTSSSDARVRAKVNGANGGDPYMSWDVKNVAGWSMGIDNSDSDKLKIYKNFNFSPAGSDFLMSFDTNGDIMMKDDLDVGHDLKVVGSSQLLDTTVISAAGSRSQLILKRTNNNRANGIAFQNAANAYTWNLYQDAGNGSFHIGGASASYPLSSITPDLTIKNDGKVGIGTTSPSTKLYVSGSLTATANSVIGVEGGADETLTVHGVVKTKDMYLDPAGKWWPDYVFEEDYELKPLNEIEEYIQENKHLPGVPSAQEVEENGYSQGDINQVLLEKIEELTLHVIQLEKRLNEKSVK